MIFYPLQEVVVVVFAKATCWSLINFEYWPLIEKSNQLDRCMEFRETFRL